MTNFHYMQVREFIYYGLNKSIRKPGPTFRFIFNSWFFKKKGWLYYLVTMILLYGGNLLLALLNDRLYAHSDNQVYNFFEDVPNQINYLFICPAYVITILYYHQTIRALPKKLKEDLLPLLNLKKKRLTMKWYWSVCWILLILVCAAIINSLYMSELDDYGYIFWFEGKLGGSDILSQVGKGYYNVTVALLLLTCLVTIYQHIVYVNASMVITRKMNRLVSDENNDQWLEKFPKKKEALEKTFKPIIDQYLISKFLIILITTNLYTWKAQNPNFLGTLDLTIIFVVLAGMMFISFPRYQIQYYLLLIRERQHVNNPIDIRSHIQRGWANLFDLIIFGSAATNLVVYVFNKLNIDISPLF